MIKKRKLNGPEYLVHAWGSATKLADDLGVDKSNVTRWTRTAIVPARHNFKILELAQRHNYPVKPGDIIVGRELKVKTVLV